MNLKIKSKFFNQEDVVEVKDEDINNVVNPIVENAIQADKDIISHIKVEYDEDNDKTMFIFPKYVMPLRFYSDDFSETVYFNYNLDKVLLGDGAVYGELQNDIANSQVRFVLNGEFSITENDDLDFIYQNRILSTLNTFTLYHKTLLYEHYIAVGDGEDFHVEFKVISTYPNEYSLDYLKNNGFEIGREGVVAISRELASDLWIYSPLSIVYGQDDLTAILCNTNTTDIETTLQIKQGGPTTFNDDVTLLTYYD